MSTTYDFDPTGTNLANRVVGEQHVVNSLDFREYNFVIPKLAPFFGENAVISFTDVNGVTRVLNEGVDFVFSHQFIQASKATAKPVFGSITFLNNATTGVVNVTYNTIGGIWTISETEIATIIAEALYNPRVTSWEQVVELPIMFPVIDHEWNTVDLIGASDVVASIEAVRDAVLASSGSPNSGHFTDTNNPHQTTKAQVGLGNVQNYPIATSTEALAGSSNATYMTPALVKLAIDSASNIPLQQHIQNTNNPHSTTKGQVGLGNVDNYATATVAQAQAGTATNLFVTPAGAKAVSDIVQQLLQQHVADQNNPHATTKDQIGFVNLRDYPIATQAEAEVGLSSERYMSPLRTRQAIDALAVTPLSSHVNNIANPHQTNKAQVGLGNVPNYGPASDSEAIALAATDKLITPITLGAALSKYNFGFPGLTVTTIAPALPAAYNGLRLARIDNTTIDLQTTHASLVYMACPSNINDDAAQSDFLYRYTDPLNPNGSRAQNGRYLKMPPAGYFQRPYDAAISGANPYKLQENQYAYATGSQNGPKSYPVYVWIWY